MRSALHTVYSSDHTERNSKNRFIIHPKQFLSLIDVKEEGGIRGVRILQKCIELCINTTQNNNMIRKPQTTLKLPKSSKYCKPLGFCKTAIPQLKIKISAKPHQKLSKTASTQTLMPSSLKVPVFLSVSWHVQDTKRDVYTSRYP